LDRVEQRHRLDDGRKDIPERVKAARRKIIEKMSDETASSETKHSLDHDLEDLFLVVQSFSYPGDYVIDKPSIERMAETLDKFEEDVLRKPTADIKARRRAKVQFGHPVEVVGDKKVKNQTTTLTTEIENRVQAMLDEG
jgi:hypothetical protein